VATPGLLGDDDERRAQVAHSLDVQGLDHAIVAPASPGHRITLHPIGKPGRDGRRQLRAWLEGWHGRVGAVQVTGTAAQPQTPRVTAVIASGGALHVTVTGLGAQSHCAVTLHQPGRVGGSRLDPAFASVEARLDPQGTPAIDPALPGPEPPAPPTGLALDAASRDYAGFRAALLERLPGLLPDWDEAHEADVGVALVELLAHAGDRLSYYQDAVATEAFLETARHRVSVRRHARLLDYVLHEGVSAQAFLHLRVAQPARLPAGTLALSRITMPLLGRPPPHGPVLDPEVGAAAVADPAVTVFETMHDLEAHPDGNGTPLHSWGLTPSSLPAGATFADLVGDATTWLRPGGLLLLEEVAATDDEGPPGADPRRRVVVRVTRVEPAYDPLEGEPLTRVAWAPEDALRQDLAVTAWSDGRKVQVAVARGNLVLADHGRTVGPETHPGPAPGADPDRAHRVWLRTSGLSQRVAHAEGLPVAAAWELPPWRAVPQVTRLDVGGVIEPDGWTWRRDLLASGPFDPHFTVEADNDGRPLVRFGQGEQGMAPPPGSTLRILYRVGVGQRGNVGADVLAHLVQPRDRPVADLLAVETVRNPLPARGGLDPESLEHARRTAPANYRATPRSALTEEDCARLVRGLPGVAGAVARLCWRGSWRVLQLAIDPEDPAGLTPGLVRRIEARVQEAAPIGTEVEVVPPAYVPVEFEATVWVEASRAPRAVEAAVAAALGNARLPDGRAGLFHPDRLTFGQGLALSLAYATIQAVAGVAACQVTRLRRMPPRRGDGEADDLAVGALEILRLDNDPGEPGNGVLRLHVLEAGP
jgi:hypothetical protein